MCSVDWEKDIFHGSISLAMRSADQAGAGVVGSLTLSFRSLVLLVCSKESSIGASFAVTSWVSEGYKCRKCIKEIEKLNGR